MLPLEVIRQIRRLQLRAKRAVQTHLGGEYHSVFKGTGLSFEEVREYQPGDDVRTIDWNVTARVGAPYIKRFVEERELSVLILVDISSSLRFGTQRNLKRTVAAEIAALIAFSAIANNDRVGLLACSDQIEQYLEPAKGTQHTLRLLRDILFFEPKRPGTSLQTGFDFLNKTLRRRVIVFAISDWLSTDFSHSFRLAARKHDLIAINISDLHERQLPQVGLLQLIDSETGQTTTIDTNSPQVRQQFVSNALRRQEAFNKLCRSCQVDQIDLTTSGDHIEALVNFFRLRNARRRRTT